MRAAELLARLRGDGWVVAVHNDYRLVGAPMTFWLFTRDDRRWIKGEGATDEIALRAALDDCERPDVRGGLLEARINADRERDAARAEVERLRVDYATLKADVRERVGALEAEVERLRAALEAAGATYDSPPDRPATKWCGTCNLAAPECDAMGVHYSVVDTGFCAGRIARRAALAPPAQKPEVG